MIYETFFDITVEPPHGVLPKQKQKLVGRGMKVDRRSADRGGIVRRALRYYFARKYPGITDATCRSLLDSVKAVFWFSVFKKLLEREMEPFRSCGTAKDFSTITSNGRPDFYIAVEMNETEDTCDVHYKRIRNVLRFQPNTDQANSYLLTHVASESHDVAIIDWALNLEVGPSNQVRCKSARAGALAQLSVEDISIVQRNIGVVEHNIPTRMSLHGSRTVLRSKRVCSFIDS